MKKSVTSELRDAQMCILMSSEIKEQLKQVAYMEQISPNYKVYQLIKQYIKDNSEKLKEYQRVFNKKEC